MKIEQSRCIYCGRFFEPDRRVGSRQKCCGRPGCRKARKRESQRKWVEKNPGYFKGRYENTKKWLSAHPGYLRKWRTGDDIQDECREERPIKSIRFLIPVRLLQDDIQDKCLILTKSDSRTYEARVGW